MSTELKWRKVDCQIAGNPYAGMRMGESGSFNILSALYSIRRWNLWMADSSFTKNGSKINAIEVPRSMTCLFANSIAIIPQSAFKPEGKYSLFKQLCWFLLFKMSMCQSRTMYFKSISRIPISDRIGERSWRRKPSILDAIDHVSSWKESHFHGIHPIPQSVLYPTQRRRRYVLLSPPPLAQKKFKCLIIISFLF